MEVRFSPEGQDEMEQVDGYGIAALSDDGKTLTGKPEYHLGDDWKFSPAEEDEMDHAHSDILLQSACEVVNVDP